MNIVCTICHDCFIPSEDISFTRCGHIFHLECLSQWVTRSDSCPQCREKTSRNNIRKLYMTFHESDSNNTDCSFMQEKIDNLKFQILLNEKNIKYYISKNDTLKKQNAGLRLEVRKVESEINEKNTNIHTLTERIKYTKEKYEFLKRNLRNKEVEKLKNIEMLLRDSIKDAEEVIGKTKDRDTLIRYIWAMKEDMLRQADKLRGLHDIFSKVQNLLTDLIPAINAFTAKISSKLNDEGHLAAKNWDPHNRIDELEKLLALSKRLCFEYALKFKSQRKWNENCFTDTQNTRITYNQAETEAATNINHDECPIYKKRAKFSQSNNDRNETNEMSMATRHDRNTASISTQ